MNSLPFLYWQGLSQGKIWFCGMTNARLTDGPGFDKDADNKTANEIMLEAGDYCDDADTYAAGLPAQSTQFIRGYLMKFIDASRLPPATGRVCPPKHSRAEVHFTDGPPLLLRGREAIRVTSDLARPSRPAPLPNHGDRRDDAPEKPKAPRRRQPMARQAKRQPHQRLVHRA